MNSPARYIMIGGFLCAGKTTAVAALAKHLTDLGQRGGLITNDQGRELVDTRMLQSRIALPRMKFREGFCCKFNSLIDAARRLTDQARPEVFIAEPVGSCTDLVATVTYPLRAQRILGLDEGAGFSERVLYIYKKQLEEADIIVVSKRDLVEGDALEPLMAALRKEFPGKRVLAVSAHDGAGLAEWFGILTSEDQVPRPALEIDYDIYADAEALLGWLNATLILESDDEVESGTVLEALATNIQRQLLAESAEVAHLKMTLTPDHGLNGEVAVINLVRNDFRPEFGQELEEPVTGAQIILNLRAEADPERLAAIVEHAVATSAPAGCRLTLDHLERFRPGRPTPTHRDVATVA